MICTEQTSACASPTNSRPGGERAKKLASQRPLCRQTAVSPIRLQRRHTFLNSQPDLISTSSYLRVSRSKSACAYALKSLLQDSAQGLCACVCVYACVRVSVHVALSVSTCMCVSMSVHVDVDRSVHG